MANSFHFVPSAADRSTFHVRDYLRERETALSALLDARATSGLKFAARRAAIIDDLLHAVYQHARARTPRKSAWGLVAFGAVGGYGRGCLGLHSDLDVRLITDSSPEQVQPIAEAILYPLWDAGVSIGHQVMTVNDAVESAQKDLPTATALLDWRFLEGDAELGHSLTERAFATLFAQDALADFFARLGTETERRHGRYGDSLYLLEPEVKSGPGGLRDLDIALWAARARFRTAGITDLAGAGILLPQESSELESAADFLWALRNHLHRSARRRSDRLTFDDQESIARSFGYRKRVKAHPGATESELSGVMVEAFMSDYYRHARVILRACERILLRVQIRASGAQQEQRSLGNGFCTVDGQVTFESPDTLLEEPLMALRLYAVAVEHGLPVLFEARDQISCATRSPEFNAALRSDAGAGALFVSLTCTVKQTQLPHDSVLRELHDVGLLLAMIPEFAPVVGRVHHDIYHVYTVDVHSIAAVDRLRALTRGELAQQQPVACRVAAEVTDPRVLFLATLLHDVGKAIGGRDHAARGAEMARIILSRLGLEPDAIDEACHLILKHLHMYLIAVRRDIEDSATIRDFSGEVHGREGLRDLYLLTIADLSTTGPASMTPWKARMLDELLLATERSLSGSAIAAPSRLARVREGVHVCWNDVPTRAFVDEYLDSMPEQYLLSNTPREIASHARVALRAAGSPVSAEIVPSRHPDVAELCVVVGERTNQTELCVVARDRPGLLAAISAALSASRLEVYAAQINSRRLPDGSLQAVDLFWVRDRVEGVQAVTAALPKLELDLLKVIVGQVAPEELLKRRRSSRWSERPAPPVQTEVIVDNRASARHTVIEVITRDRPGLLYTLSRAFHELGLTIAIAKINTEGARVADVFYVSELQGGKIRSEQRIDEVRQKLIGCLRPNDDASSTVP
ncbi:MAG TPA: [protein-PII] uridylyltransferase [Polyangiaceae bacterium]|nr:[protein-PII] uridylyltransferase [Polyangiaceae bacterium]